MGNGPAQVAQMADMRNHSPAHTGIFDIGDTEILAGIPDDLADGRVMHMGYPGKQVMFDLEIEAAHPPGNKPVTGRKIGGGFELVDSPFVFHFMGFHIGFGE